MKLMTKAIEKKIPALYSTEEENQESPRILVKFFHVFSSWRWYGVEYDPEQGLFYGLVDGDEMELGYFTLDELESIEIGGLGIERDMNWDDKITVQHVMDAKSKSNSYIV